MQVCLELVDRDILECVKGVPIVVAYVRKLSSDDLTPSAYYKVRRVNRIPKPQPRPTWETRNW